MSSGVPISFKMGPEIKNPRIPTNTPDTMLIAIAVWTHFRMPASSLAPIKRAHTTPEPVDNPMNKLRIRLTRELVEPTAAREALPANLPMTIMSAAL